MVEKAFVVEAFPLVDAAFPLMDEAFVTALKSLGGQNLLNRNRLKVFRESPEIFKEIISLKCWPINSHVNN